MAQGTDRNARGAPPPARWVKPAVRIAVAVAVIAMGVSAEPAEPGEASPASPRSQRAPRPDVTAIVELQRQLNELRSDLLDEREKRIGRWQESNGTALVVLGIAIGIGGLWAYAKFPAIAAPAEMGIAAARGHAYSPWVGLPPPGTAPALSGQVPQPSPLLVGAGPGPGGDVARHG